MLISRKGLCSRCLEIRDSLARGVARAKDERGPRQKKVWRNAATTPTAMGKFEEILIGMREQEKVEALDCTSLCDEEELLQCYIHGRSWCFFMVADRADMGPSAASQGTNVAVSPTDQSSITLQTRRIIYKQIKAYLRSLILPD